MQIRGASGEHGLTALLDRHERYETGASCVFILGTQRALEHHGDHRATLNTGGSGAGRRSSTHGPGVVDRLYGARRSDKNRRHGAGPPLGEARDASR